MAILEPERVGKMIAVAPDDYDGRTKAGKALKADAAAAGLLWITSAEWMRVSRMRDAVMSDPTARAYIEAAGECEREVYWDEQGQAAKAKLDKLVAGGPVIDLKTTQDASLNGFTRSCFSNYRYDIQAEWYLRASTHIRGSVRSDFVFICVESEEPHVVQCYRIDEVALENASDEIDLILSRVATARAAGVWPAYGGGLQNLYPPAWF
jgi:exodeoxyribonuclease VIII